jgi:hypothetical protein
MQAPASGHLPPQKTHQIGEWGAGQKGKDFLAECDSKKGYIDYVIDKNVDKWGEKLETNHEVVGLAKIQSDIQMVLVMNRVYYGEISRTIKQVKSNILVFDFEAYLILGTIEKIDEFVE